MPDASRGPRWSLLAAHLAAQPADVQTLPLTLGEIAAIVGAPLSRTARHRGWWGNSATLQQARHWRAAGWRVERRDLYGMTPAVTFARIGPDTPP